MVNTLGVYDPIFYAQEALIQLEQSLGMANTVYRGYDEERKTFQKGQTISIRRPSTFTAEDAPGAAQDVATETVDMLLNNYRIVRFKVPDNELAFTGERLIADHIRPAAYALARDVDTKLGLLYRDVGWIHALNAVPGSVVKDVTGPRRIMFDNAVPLAEVQNMFYMVDGELEQGLIENSAFAQWQGAGPTGVNTQVTGAMGMRYGLNHFSNQNVQAHTKGTLVIGTALQLNAAVAKGATSIVFKDSGGSLSGTVKAGDTFVIAGSTQRYAIAADATAATNLITVTLSEPAKQAYTISSVVTISQVTTTAENLAYHRNAFGFVSAPLPASIIRDASGAKVETVTDPKTGLSLRARIWYDGNLSETHVALDILYAVKTFDPNLACRAYAA